MFEPALRVLHEKGLSMADAVVEVGNSNGVNLVVANRRTEPVLLHEGEVLGKIQPVTLMEHADDDQPNSLRVAAIAREKDCSGREKELWAALDIDAVGLRVTECEQLRSLVMEFSDVFVLNGSELGRTTITAHKIDTGDSPPLRHRVPFALRGKVDSLVDDMLEQGVITPSSSPWASPIVLVAKKDGSTRFCVDYRRLNSVTKLDVHSLPRIDDSLDLLAGTRYFSSLDLVSGGDGGGLTREDRVRDLCRAVRIHGDAVRPLQCPRDIPAADGRSITWPSEGKVSCLP